MGKAFLQRLENLWAALQLNFYFFLFWQVQLVTFLHVPSGPNGGKISRVWIFLMGVVLSRQLSKRQWKRKTNGFILDSHE